MDIDEISKRLKQLPLQVAKLTPCNEKPNAPWDSFFGGNAYWPKNQAYPLSANGQPMTMIAQINCSELKGLEHYPNQGLLQFFIANDDMYGLNFDAPFEESYKNTSGHQVIYHPAFQKNSDDWEVAKAPRKKEYSPISGCYALTIDIQNESLSPTDYRFDTWVVDPMSLSDEVSDWLYDNHLVEGSKLGGYAHFTQEDPRRYANDKEWLLLFQLDSSNDPNIDILWGDCGVGSFFIKADDLDNLDFTRICYSWDCC